MVRSDEPCMRYCAMLRGDPRLPDVEWRRYGGNSHRDFGVHGSRMGKQLLSSGAEIRGLSLFLRNEI